MSEDCACLYGDGECEEEFPLQIARTRTARKEHQCCECRQPILPGQKYQHYVGNMEGSVFTQKTCAICAEVRDALYCDGYFFGRLWGDVEDQLFPKFSVACVDKLETPEAKTELTRRYREFLGLEF